jgi:hypothetical protein
VSGLSLIAAASTFIALNRSGTLPGTSLTRRARLGRRSGRRVGRGFHSLGGGTLKADHNAHRSRTAVTGHVDTRNNVRARHFARHSFRGASARRLGHGDP